MPVIFCSFVCLYKVSAALESVTFPGVSSCLLLFFSVGAAGGCGWGGN